MKNVVNQAPFVNYPKVIKMLSAVETLFQDIETLTTANASESAKARVPVSQPAVQNTKKKRGRKRGKNSIK